MSTNQTGLRGVGDTEAKSWLPMYARQLIVPNRAPPSFPMKSNLDPTKNFYTLLADLEEAFRLQLDRLRAHPSAHSLGAKKPSLEEQEARLLGEHGRD